MIDMGDNRNVPQIRTDGHAETLSRTRLRATPRV
jgi:hypothetical protein